MFKPTVDNLYHIMKDMTVKPSLYKKKLYLYRTNLNNTSAFWTVLNNQKDLEIQKRSNTVYRFKLSQYTYSVTNPIGENKQCLFMVRKYDSKNSNEFIPIHSISTS